MLVEKTKKLKINENLEVSKFQPQKKKNSSHQLQQEKHINLNEVRQQKIIVAD